MSKNGGICSVNLKKNTKNFSEPLQCRMRPFRYHLYHHAQTVDLQGFTAILRCNSNGFPCFTPRETLTPQGFAAIFSEIMEFPQRCVKFPLRCAVCAVTMRAISLRTFPTLVQLIAPPMSASSVQSNVILANPLYIANLNIRLLYIIVCDVLLILYDMITHLNE